jgi:hypothetical protein
MEAELPPAPSPVQVGEGVDAELPPEGPGEGLAFCKVFRQPDSIFKEQTSCQSAAALQRNYGATFTWDRKQLLEESETLSSCE